MVKKHDRYLEWGRNSFLLKRLSRKIIQIMMEMRSKRIEKRLVQCRCNEQRMLDEKERIRKKILKEIGSH